MNIYDPQFSKSVVILLLSPYTEEVQARIFSGGTVLIRKLVVC